MINDNNSLTGEHPCGDKGHMVFHQSDSKVITTGVHRLCKTSSVFWNNAVLQKNTKVANYLTG